MSATANRLRKIRIEDSYLSLVLEHPLRAIHTRKDYAEASKMVDRLAVRDGLDEGEQQYLDAIEVLIEGYENKRLPVARDDRTPLERLKALMQASRMTPAQIRRVLGASQPMVSMILSGQRSLSKKAIVKLAEHFNLDAGYFL